MYDDSKADLLQVALIQLDISWKDPQGNLCRIDQLIKEIKADLIVLPEMFATGFIDDPDQTDLGDDFSLEWIKQTARNKNAAVVGSLAVQEDGNFYNRMYFVTPNQEIVSYDKKHLFALGDEAKAFKSGERPMLASYRVGLFLFLFVMTCAFRPGLAITLLMMYIYVWRIGPRQE